MSFWESKSGQPITGSPDAAFVKDFEIIPNNTMALAKIKSFEVVEEQNQYKGPQKYIKVIYKITDGDFINREVIQKIKPFDGEPKQIDRNLNMLRLIMELCSYKPEHSNEPTNADLMRMNGKALGIKIREWSMPKKEGGLMEGNFVSEVHPPAGFVSQTGVRSERVYSSPVDSALNRNSQARVDSLEEDLPF